MTMTKILLIGLLLLAGCSGRTVCTETKTKVIHNNPKHDAMCNDNGTGSLCLSTPGLMCSASGCKLTAIYYYVSISCS